jgi:hypothetical protein
MATPQTLSGNLREDLLTKAGSPLLPEASEKREDEVEKDKVPDTTST